MVNKILVEKGYIIDNHAVPDRYIELEDNEELCHSCGGRGRVSHGTLGDGMKSCPNCGGSGKRLINCNKAKSGD